MIWNSSDDKCSLKCGNLQHVGTCRSQRHLEGPTGALKTAILNSCTSRDDNAKMFTEGTNYSYLLLNLSDSWVLIPTAGKLTPDKDTTTRSFILKFPTEDRQVLIVQPYSYHHPRTENSDQGQRWRRSRSNKLTPCPWALVLISASDTSFWVTWIPFFAETTCQFCFHHTRVYISQEQFLGDISQKARPPLDPDKKSPSSLVFLPQPFQGPSVCKRKSPYSFMEIILWVPRTAKFPI